MLKNMAVKEADRECLRDTRKGTEKGFKEKVMPEGTGHTILLGKVSLTTTGHLSKGKKGKIANPITMYSETAVLNKFLHFTTGQHLLKYSKQLVITYRNTEQEAAYWM